MGSAGDGDEWGAWPEGVTTEETLARCRDETALFALQRLGFCWEGQGRVVLEIVGADSTEGVTASEVCRCFARVIATAEQHGRHLLLLLTGPNAPASLVGEVHRPHPTISIECVQMPYEVYVTQRELPCTDHRFALCFNAGMWGYDSWRPAVAALLQHSGEVPVVVTAYSATEADADEEVVDSVAAGLCVEGGVPQALPVDAAPAWYAWESIRNPYRSLHPRPSSVSDEILHDSQCVFSLRWNRLSE